MSDFGLPSFPPFHIDELRELYARHAEPEVRRLILEVERSRRVLAEVEYLRGVIDQAWQADVGGHLVALYKLRLLLQQERERNGGLGPFCG
jgi:predicted RNA-binding Zn ribbon-like protein